ncbi:uncharacterized protein AMSG_03330 [Thecamonas trahens ATCC 50062]|uniref:FH2 domain-containing protein n=1 Tax=Thecamonas trahens ATCC 50062 TaxID=461836 RepID=A0A0L0D3M7_THETB|nr:hypothetical protein AMSG_03330 [Thecamonas trahens ATCC 50062]KNC46899.1 hypothetical protein AMSG_03330 [Thecamonas trahens ATCC 50062]|eukprot:XP_013760172.1 hypothetical protein AMSG_03330 [Thecamonas trahens ATCC 50062]
MGKDKAKEKEAKARAKAEAKRAKEEAKRAKEEAKRAKKEAKEREKAEKAAKKKAEKEAKSKKARKKGKSSESAKVPQKAEKVPDAAPERNPEPVPQTEAPAAAKPARASAKGKGKAKAKQAAANSGSGSSSSSSSGYSSGSGSSSSSSGSRSDAGGDEAGASGPAVKAAVPSGESKMRGARGLSALVAKHTNIEALTVVKAENRLLKEKNESLSADVKELTAENTRLAAKQEKTKTKLDGLREAYTDMSTAFEQAKTKNQELVAIVAEVQKEAGKLEAQIEHDATAHAAAIRELKAELNDKLSELEAAAVDRDAAAASRDAAAADAAAAAAAAAELQIQVSQLAEELKELKARAPLMQPSPEKAVQAESVAASDSEAASAELLAEVETLKASLAGKDEELAKLRSQLEEARSAASGMPGGAIALPRGKPKIKPRVRMKGLFWKKVKTLPPTHPQYVPTVWEDLEEPEFDIDRLEELFGKKTGGGSGASGGATAVAAAKPKFTNVLDGKRYNAVAFMMAKLPKAPELARAVLELDDSVLNPEAVSQLLANMGTPEEIAAIKSADTSEAPLDRPEQFVLDLSEIPLLGKRLLVWKNVQSFAEAAADVSQPLAALDDAISETKSSPLLLDIIAHVLAVGNYLNGSTSRGQAMGYDLDSLFKINDLKDSRNKSTLLHFVVNEIMDKAAATAAAATAERSSDGDGDEQQQPSEAATSNQTDPLALAEQLAAVPAGARVSLDELEGGIKRLTKLVAETQAAAKVVMEASAGEDGEGASSGDAFATKLVPELARMEADVAEFQDTFTKLAAGFTDMLLFYGYTKRSVSKVKPNEFFASLAEFTEAYEAVREKIVKARAKAAKAREAEQKLARERQERLKHLGDLAVDDGSTRELTEAGVAATSLSRASTVDDLVMSLKSGGSSDKKKRRRN